MSPTRVIEPPLDFAALNRQFAQSEPTDLIAWADQTFGSGLVLSTSFGAQSAVMLHLVTRVVPGIAVIWIDTGFNFSQTYTYAEELTKRLKLNLKVYQSDLSPGRMTALHGRLWEMGADGMDTYHRIRKIEPRDRAFRELNVASWLNGPRRDQTDLRKSLQKVENFDGIAKIHPILDWPSRQVHAYMTEHDLPCHPLVAQGYVSIGDWHSTESVSGSQQERAGRFAGLKQECGLHVPQTEAENASRESCGL